MMNRSGLFNRPEPKPEDKKVLEASAFQPSTPPRSAQTPPAAAPATPSKASSESPAPVQKAHVADEPSGSKLIVGPNIRLKGVEITNCDTLVVEGHVEATMDSRLIQIAQPGTFSGTVGIDVAEIGGTFTGELTARKRLVVHSTGKVSGKIRYGKLIIEEGGEIEGDVTSITSSQGAAGGVSVNTKAVATSDLRH